MPTININRKVFEKLVGKKLPLEKLKDRISYLGTDLESVSEKEIVVEMHYTLLQMIVDGLKIKKQFVDKIQQDFGNGQD